MPNSVQMLQKSQREGFFNEDSGRFKFFMTNIHSFCRLDMMEAIIKRARAYPKVCGSTSFWNEALSIYGQVLELKISLNVSSETLPK